jgi:hypothetical protein
VRRQDALSQRVSRISNLLRTRVEIEQQQSSQALLGTMNRRQDLQLKLQATVEGLSVAAITYYIVGLVSYLAKARRRWAGRSAPRRPRPAPSRSWPAPSGCRCAGCMPGSSATEQRAPAWPAC